MQQQTERSLGIPCCQSTWMSIYACMWRAVQSASLRLNISETNGTSDKRAVYYWEPIEKCPREGESNGHVTSLPVTSRNRIT